jgi:hypothetical protein
MLEGVAGTIVGAPAITEAPAPVVDGPKEGEVADQSTATPKFPGWTGQLAKDQLADIQARVAKDPKALETLPKGLSELYAAYASLSESSKGALARPPQDAPKEVWDQFYKELGRPESAEGYTLEKPEIPSGMRYDDEMEKWFRGVALARNLSNDAAKGIFADWNKAQAEANARAFAARQKEATDAMTALKTEWGDKFADNWEGMRQAYLQFVPGGEKGRLFQKIQAQKLDNDPDFLKMFRNIYTKIGPAKTVVPTEAGGGTEKSGGFQFGAGLKPRE